MPSTSPPAAQARQLPLPLDQQPPKPIAPSVAIASIRPAQVLATLPPNVRRQMRQVWIRVFQEVMRDGNGT